MNISICKQHNKSFKFLCNDCNHLICSRCIGQSHCGHKCIHVDDIKINLSQQNIFTDLKSINDKYNQNKNSNNDNDINNDNNNNNDNENNNNDNNNNKNPNYMISTVESLLESINNIKSAIAPIQEKENTIVDHFKEIYNFLMSEESRLKKPLTDAIDTLNDQIKINNKEIESLLSVVMCYQQLLNSSEENEIKSASTSYFEDKVYQSLVETFSQLDLNTSTELVSKDMEQIVKQYNHIGLDFILLELLQRQRSKVQNRKLDIKELIDISNKKKDYKVFINNQSLQKLKQSLKESISVSNGKVLLISSNIEKGATIYDLSQSDIKLVVGNMNIGFECKSKSIFSSNEYIYFFDGKSYIKFSILNHIVNQKDQKEGIIEEMNYENVEYFNLFKDNKGIVYYFLVAADNSTKIIIGEFNLPYMSLNDPFFIIDRNTEYFIGDINFIGDQGLFFTFKEKIYVVTSLYIHSYCLESKIRETFRFIYQSNIISICNDDHGNIYYIYEEKNKLYFKKYNVITRGIIEYTISFPLSKSCPLLYHSDRLFLICGPDMNYIFDIRTTEWCKFDSDGLDRWGCGAIIVELK